MEDRGSDSKQPVPSKIVSPSEIRRDTQLSLTTIYRNMREGTIPSILVGKKKRIVPRTQYEKWLQGQ